MRKVQLLPNIITAFGLSCGLFLIFKMNMTAPGEATYPVLLSVAGLLLLAALADLLDGAIARAMKAESDFGGIFDSLADAITFGVGPSIIVLKSLSLAPGTKISFLVTAAAMVYSVCGVLRLVRFTILDQRSKGDEKQTLLNKKNFTGLPIPAAAAAVVSVNLLLASEDFIFLDNLTKAWIMCIVLCVIGYLMISRWKFFSFKALHIKVSSFQIVLLTVFIAVLVFYGLLHHLPWVFLAFSWSYVIVAWILSIIRLIWGKETPTLEDFEPEPDYDDEII